MASVKFDSVASREKETERCRCVRTQFITTTSARSSSPRAIVAAFGRAERAETPRGFYFLNEDSPVRIAAAKMPARRDEEVRGDKTRRAAGETIREGLISLPFGSPGWIVIGARATVSGMPQFSAFKAGCISCARRSPEREKRRKDLLVIAANAVFFFTRVGNFCEFLRRCTRQRSEAVALFQPRFFWPRNRGDFELLRYAYRWSKQIIDVLNGGFRG